MTAAPSRLLFQSGDRPLGPVAGAKPGLASAAVFLEDAEPAAAVRMALVPERTAKRLGMSLQRAGLELAEADLRNRLDHSTSRMHVVALSQQQLYLAHLPKRVLSSAEPQNWHAVDGLRHSLAKGSRIVFMASDLESIALPYLRLFDSWAPNDLRASFVSWKHLMDALDSEASPDELLYLFDLQPVASGDGGSGLRDEVFISYAHEDAVWKKRLVEMLAPVKDRIRLWEDERIEAGSDWERDIQSALARAKVAVLLVTPAFLDSEYIEKVELPALLKAADEEGVKILCVAVRKALVEHSLIKRFQFVNDPAVPLAAVSGDTDSALADIATQIVSAAGVGSTSAGEP